MIARNGGHSYFSLRGEMRMEKTEELTVIPYFCHEGEMNRLERVNKRQFFLIVLLILALIGTNGAWIMYENSFQDIVVTQDSMDGNNNYIGNDGEIVNY